jgi:glycolate oxidase iron-sulfur subunit
MQTTIGKESAGTPGAEEAAAIVRKCVHCGFCNATCPTYQLLGNELDGPRGRIYLIKGALEGAEVTRSTQVHLDRCLTCLACETTCPSGVEYGRLLHIGRQVVGKKVPRPAGQRLLRWALRSGLTSRLFAPLVSLARHLKPVLPRAWRQRVGVQPSRQARNWPSRRHARKVLLLAGCVQPALRPDINAATARVLDAAGIQVIVAARAGCCGALRTHLDDAAGGQADMRRNIDAWWPMVEAGDIEAIISNASACGAMVKDYGHALAADVHYAAKAARVSALARDLSEWLPELSGILANLLRAMPGRAARQRISLHVPCTLQHGQRLRGGIEAQLASLGFDIRVPAEGAHLCCGSAGTYSILQPQLAGQLRALKLQHLQASGPAVIVSANIGCIEHLQAGTHLPVRHWVEVLDEAMFPGP